MRLADSRYPAEGQGKYRETAHPAVPAQPAPRRRPEPVMTHIKSNFDPRNTSLQTATDRAFGILMTQEQKRCTRRLNYA